MSLARWSVSLVAIIGLLAATIAGGDDLAARHRSRSRSPIAVSTGDVGAVVQAIGAVIFDALQGLFKYL